MLVAAQDSLVYSGQRNRVNDDNSSRNSEDCCRHDVTQLAAERRNVSLPTNIALQDCVINKAAKSSLVSVFFRLGCVGVDSQLMLLQYSIFS